MDNMVGLIQIKNIFLKRGGGGVIIKLQKKS